MSDLDPRIDQLLANPLIRLLLGGRVVFPLSSAARTDVAGHGEINFYVSGSTIVAQMYDLNAAAWRTVSLT